MPLEDVTEPTTVWAEKDYIVIQNPGFENVTGDWPDDWILTSGSAAQVVAKAGDPSSAD